MFMFMEQREGGDSSPGAALFSSRARREAMTIS